ncbi:MAG: aminoacyl-tRNA hydrolase [Spirochaetota bacterium]|jgi:PTH1 family peptidyl-tRNA hydrolase|nr:aminoacyl-tRNA hydrolase [Spirochaetota bacterium]
MKLLIGLGNPGERYHNTRHNLGFLALDHFAGDCGFGFSRKKHDALWARGVCGGQEFIAIKPQTFMNLSGIAARAFAEEYQISPEEVIILCDDIYQPFGRLRIRKAGSAGGHNGLASVIECLGADSVMRIRLGVGKPEDESADLADYVLSALTAVESERVPVLCGWVSKAIALILQGDINKAMNICHGRDCGEAE